MAAWTQKGFALISDIYPGDKAMPMLHAFRPGRSEVEYELQKAQGLPERLRTGIRIVGAELHFSD